MHFLFRIVGFAAVVGETRCVGVARNEQMSHIQLYEQGDMDYSNDNFRRSTELKLSKRVRPVGRRRGKSPQSVNGIHRRRNRKLAW